MKFTVMYIANRWLRTKNLIHHIIILQGPNDIDMMQHLRLILSHPGRIWFVSE